MKNLSAEELAIKLTQLDACEEAQTWASGKSLAEVWATCHRGDWMLWLVGRYGEVDHKALVAITCDCAEPALAFVPVGEQGPAKCIATVRRWLKDEATIEEVRAAWAAAKAAAKAAAWAAEAAMGAAKAAKAAAWAAEAAAWTARAAMAARAAAEAETTMAEATMAARAARNESLQFSADICRKYIHVDL